MAGRQNSRGEILDAAEAVVLEAGAAHLTLDAVAKKAGVSKGGLLYHFPSKDSLMKGMIARCMDDFAQEIRTSSAQFGDEAPGDLKAFVTASLNDTPAQKQVAASLLAAGANNPELLRPVLEYNEELFGTRSRSRRRSARSIAVMLGATGLWFMETFQLSPLSATQRKQVIRELLTMAEESVS